MSKMVYFKNLHYAAEPEIVREYFIAINTPKRFSAGSVIVTMYRTDGKDSRITRTFNYHELKKGFFNEYIQAVELELETLLCDKEKKDHE